MQEEHALSPRECPTGKSLPNSDHVGMEMMNEATAERRLCWNGVEIVIAKQKAPILLIHREQQF